MQPYTSGSTGKPKGVLLAHGGQIWNADVLKSLLCDDTERALVAVPLFHKNAMVGAVKPFLLAGGSLVILPGFDPVEVIRAIDHYRVTYLTGVPAMYRMILAEREAGPTRRARFAMHCAARPKCPTSSSTSSARFSAPNRGKLRSHGGRPRSPVQCAWALKRRGSCGRDSRLRCPPAR